jgi:hypothetical protein
MTPTIRKNTFAVDLSAATSQFLNYRLQVIEGAGAVFGWSDDNRTPILPMPDAPAVTDFSWQLKSAVVGGQVQLTVPQNGGYIRNETSPKRTAYAITLFFPTAIKYTFTIDLCNADGSVAVNLVDIDFTRDQGNQNDKAEHVEEVNI